MEQRLFMASRERGIYFTKAWIATSREENVLMPDLVQLQGIVQRQVIPLCHSMHYIFTMLIAVPTADLEEPSGASFIGSL